MARVMNEVLRSVTLNYLDTIDPANPRSPNDIQDAILEETNIQFQIRHSRRNPLLRSPFGASCPSRNGDYVRGAHDSVSRCLKSVYDIQFCFNKIIKKQNFKSSLIRDGIKGTNRCLLYRLYSFKNKNIIHGLSVILTLNLRRNY